MALVALLFVANQTNDDSESSLAASPAKTQGDRLDGIVFGTVTNPPQSTTSTTPAAENQTGLNIEARAVSVEAVAAAREQLDDVRVVSEFTGFTDYVRDDYTGGGWPDSDGDCQSDRHEILIEESLVEPTLDADGCRVLSGLWIDAYDGTTYTEADQVTIDHFVPLAAAHRAGGWEWDIEQKRAFSSDIEFPASHAAVGSAVNQSKADRGPEEWRPPRETAWCWYAVDWVAVKSRWDLAFTEAEVDAVIEMLDTCEELVDSAVAPTIE